MVDIPFTPEQRKAIEHEKGGLQLIACAGAGKTEVISRRIAKLIEKGANPSEIVAFTFTEKAADEMKARIRKILDEECPERADFGDMYVGTIHSFCFYMLKELEPKYKSYDVLDEAQRVAYVSVPNNYYSKIRLRGLEGPKLRKYKVIDKFLRSADIIRNEDINPSKLHDKEFVRAYENYISLLDQDRYLDFSEMINRLVKLVKKNRNIRKDLHKKINHLIVDEYQDVNMIQEKLIEIISEGCKSVCVVGDDDQCVYQWRGSDPRYIIDFEKRYTKRFRIEKIPLETNFRSTKAIIHTAREFIRKNDMRLTKEMKTKPKPARKYELGDIIHQHFESQEDEFEFICNTIKEIIGAQFSDKHGKPYSISLFDIAVLVRRNDDAARLIPYLEHHGIHFVLGGGRNLFQRDEVLLAADCIAYVFETTGINFQNVTKKQLVDRYEFVFSKAKFPKANAYPFIKKIEKIRKKIAKIKKKGRKDYLPKGLQVFYHAILNAMGIEEFDIPDEMHYNLAVLSQAISDYESVWKRLRASEVKYFFGFLTAFANGHYTESMHNDPALINAVKVMTIHKAKGLEFPVVFIPGMVKKRKPAEKQLYVDDEFYSSELYRGNIEDERRVFYTAFTRSEKYLFLTGYKKHPSYKKEYVPHDFIMELEKEYITDELPDFPKKGALLPRSFNSAIYPTSFSELNVYERCPQDFKLRHVFGYNAGVPPTFGYGTNIHNILNVIHKRYKKKPPSETEIDQIFEKMFMMRYATEKIAENMKKAGKEIVKNYVKEHGEAFREILETEKQFEFVLDMAIISGQIDLIKKVDENGNLKDIEIIDFKTEKSVSYALDYETQLRLYTLACMKSLGLNPKKAAVHHLDSGNKDYVEITPKKIEETRKTVSKRVNCILEKKFPAKPSKEKCIECDYEKICPMKKLKWEGKL